MNVANLVIGVLGFLAAALAAWFAYPAYRQARSRPDLRLHAVPKGSTMSTESGEFAFQLELRNGEEAGAASDWHLSLTAAGHRRIHAFDRSKPPSGIFTERSGADWSIQWHSDGADDMIGPGLTRQATCKTDAFPYDDPLAFDYTITAHRMKPRSGRLDLAFSPGPPRQPVVMVT